MERTPLHDLSRDDLIGLILGLQKQLTDLEKRNAELAARNEELARRIEELEKKNPTVRLDEAFSMRAEEERQAKAASDGKRNKQKSTRRGRISTDEKLAKATLEEKIWPKQFRFAECQLRYSRPVWRIINGQAVLVAYHIYAGPDGTVPQIPGVLKRCEFGQEISITLAHQHYIIGLPLDKAIAEIEFFWGLKLRKSQADAMLNRMAREWLPEFEALCDLLAFSAVVHADETSWSINSVWAFLSEKARITVFGCHKDGETLAALLDKDEFKGKLVSDNAAVYQGFSNSQKCWAHLIRKAIRLTLLKPNRPRYRQFLNSLQDIYRRGKKIAADKRLSEAGRRARANQLHDAIYDCTANRFCDNSTPADDEEKDFYNLTHEILRLLREDELFTYVIHPEVPGTNNESERSLRGAAQDRRTGRTSKTEHGARRRTIIGSVLDSLRLHLPKPNLQAIQAEIARWYDDGVSCFRSMVTSLNIPERRLPENVSSVLDLMVPLTDTG